MRLWFLLVLFGMSSFSWGQRKQAAVWVFGQEIKLDFNEIPVKFSRLPFGDGKQGIASICDSNGVLQFFANGYDIRNQKSQLIVRFQQQFPQYGGGSFGCNVIVPYQSNPSLYQYFSIRGPFGNLGRFSIYRFLIDMRLNNGLGGIDDAETKVVYDRADLQIACMLHANEKDTWLISRKWQSDTLIAFQVVDTGIVSTIYSKTGSPASISNIPVDAYDSQLKSSPNSEFMLNPRRRKEFPFHELYKFNRDSGSFSKPIYISDTMKTNQFYLNGYPDGAFSPDSKRLYISTGTRKNSNLDSEGPGHFWQYSLEDYDSLSIAESRIYLGLLGRGVPNKPEHWPFSPKMQLAIADSLFCQPATTPHPKHFHSSLIDNDRPPY